MRRYRIIISRWLRKILRIHGSPHAIAVGTSIGVFVSMLPLYGFQMIIGLALATVARVNKLAAVVPAWITNPLTIPPILYCQYHLGRLLVGELGDDAPGVWEGIKEVGQAAGRISFFKLQETLGEVFEAAKALGWPVLWPTLVGGIISGLILGLVTYPLALRGVLWFRRRKQEKRRARTERIRLHNSGRQQAVVDGVSEKQESESEQENSGEESSAS
jgi:uncharacterized protein